MPATSQNLQPRCTAPLDLRRTAGTEKGASTLIFSLASLELRLSEPAKPAAPTESGYPQGHRT